MFNALVTSTLLAAATPARATDWTPTIGLIMIACNLVAIAIAKLTVKYPNEGPALPASNFFGGFGVPGLLAATSFGHLLGAGVILGLSNMGVI